ncbi:Hypothetical_protein [Hexamita inflata]|uniref:Hypothetical_protein n=1 Tax=Hexamita inflata TaxID=28002 RepID=A0AA86V2M9_9EUKA|nr:Hypothetical protein HINF_LOCUS65924 [Hexamita inflata]
MESLFIINKTSGAMLYHRIFDDQSAIQQVQQTLQHNRFSFTPIKPVKLRNKQDIQMLDPIGQAYTYWVQFINLVELQQKMWDGNPFNNNKNLLNSITTSDQIIYFVQDQNIDIVLVCVFKTSKKIATVTELSSSDSELDMNPQAANSVLVESKIEQNISDLAKQLSQTLLSTFVSTFKKSLVTDCTTSKQRYYRFDKLVPEIVISQLQGVLQNSELIIYQTRGAEGYPELPMQLPKLILNDIFQEIMRINKIKIFGSENETGRVIVIIEKNEPEWLKIIQDVTK